MTCSCSIVHDTALKGQSCTSNILLYPMVVFQVELFKATMARKAAQFLEGQMVEKAARDTQIAALYTNEPKPEYFRQFGTSHR